MRPLRSISWGAAIIIPSFFLSAAATAYPSDQSPLLPPPTPNRNASAPPRAVSASLFAELEELARMVDISYCVGLTGLGVSKPFTCLSRCADFPDLELVTTWNTGALLSDSCGYIALDHARRRIVTAFRGTYSIANTVVDLSTVPQQYVPYPGEEEDDPKEDRGAAGSGDDRPTAPAKCHNCTVHMGFRRAWRNTREAILSDLRAQVALFPDYRLNLVGHSLGGAVAALAGLDFQAHGWNPLVTTFGEPRIGNAALAQYLDQVFHLPSNTSSESSSRLERLQYRRLTHVDDPIPLLPLTEWGYAMHAGEIHIAKASLSPDIQDLHFCLGDYDPECIAGQDSTVSRLQSAADPRSTKAQKRDLIGSVRDEIDDVLVEPWGVPSRYKLWQLFFAHRDYFWRLGLCVPGGDPLGGGSKYGQVTSDEV